MRSGATRSSGVARWMTRSGATRSSGVGLRPHTTLVGWRLCSGVVDKFMKKDKKIAPTWDINEYFGSFLTSVVWGRNPRKK